MRPLWSEPSCPLGSSAHLWTATPATPWRSPGSLLPGGSPKTSSWPYSRRDSQRVQPAHPLPSLSLPGPSPALIFIVASGARAQRRCCYLPAPWSWQSHLSSVPYSLYIKWEIIILPGTMQVRSQQDSTCKGLRMAFGREKAVKKYWLLSLLWLYNV